MEVTYQNLIIDVQDESQEFTGSMAFEVPLETFKEFYDYNDGTIEYFEAEEHEGWEENETFYSSNADLFILLTNWMMDNEERYNITYYGKYFWLFHDIGHALNDVSGGVIYPSGMAENRANAFSLEQLKEQNIDFDLSYEETENFKDEFYKRFNEPETALDIEELFYSFDEDEY